MSVSRRVLSTQPAASTADDPALRRASRTATLALVLALALPLAAVATAGPASAARPAARSVAAAAGTAVADLRTNSLVDPLGIAGTDPLLSWQLTGNRRGTAQTAYEIHVASSAARVPAGDVWNSGKVTSAQSLDVAYGGPDLTATTRYYWSVRVWDETGTPTDWAPTAWFETGLLAPSAWTGSFIGGNNTADAKWTDYTIEFNAKVTGALGVFFRAKDSGNAYMWQFNQASNNLRPHTKVNGNYAVVGATPTMPAGFDWTKSHKFSVTVDGTNITTKVDDVVLDTRTSTTLTTPGYVGVRTSAAANESGVVRDLKVTSKDGTVLINTAFGANDGTFAGSTITGAGLSVSGDTELWQTQASSMPVLRKEFATTAGKTVASARVYATALGHYKLFLNGKRVGDQELAPGWTDYRVRVQTQSYDVTAQLAAGNNAFGAQIADGWFAGSIAFSGANRYGNDPRVLAELHVTYTDGSTQVIKTDDTWRTTNGPILAADMFNGETYDNQRALALSGWDTAGFDASAWTGPIVDSAAYLARLVPQTDQPVRFTQEVPAVAMTSPSAKTFIYDLGQNMVGVPKLTLAGTAGQTVRIRYAEVLNPDGTMYTANLRTAKATDYYTFGATGTETYIPNFTFHGFRFLEITGLDSAPALGAVVGKVMGTDLDFTSNLTTSSSLVNQLQSNITWGQRGNFVSIPTDTPARDERLGWAGDINVFSRTATYNMDSQLFLSKWLQDLRDAQKANGAYTSIAPTVPNGFDGNNNASGWADAGINVPWQIWQAYGDTALLAEHYDSMTKFLSFLTSTATAGIRPGGEYNDWLNLDDDTPSEVVGTAFYAKSARQLSQMAGALGKTSDAATYAALYESVKSAFQAKFVKADGTIGSDSQTSYILALTNDLVPAASMEAVGAKFAATITRRDVHLSTGFLGVDGLLPALTKIGRTDLAYRLLQNTDYPSWGYEIGKGATTVWERWNSIMPDGSFGPVDMNSFNHYAYGAVGEWMYQTMAGVSAAEPGYKKSLIAPQAGAGIDHVDFTHDTRYGPVSSAWVKDGANFDLDVAVPANTTATVVIPAANILSVTESGTPVAGAAGVTKVSDTGDTVTAQVASGSYSFTVDAAVGALAEAAVRSSDLAAVVTSLEGSSAISGGQANHIRSVLSALDQKLTAAISAAGTDDAAALAAIDQALVAVAAETAWITGPGGVATAPAKTLADALAGISALLNTAAVEALDFSATVTAPTDERVPGAAAAVSVALKNGGSVALTGVTDKVTVPGQWSVSPVQAPPVPLAAGGTGTFSHVVTVGSGSALGKVDFAVSVLVPIGASTVEVPLAAKLTVTSPISITTAAVSPGTSAVGTNATLTATVHNSGDFPITGSLGAKVPTGWAAPLRSNPVTVAPGADATISIPLPISLDATNNGVAALTATFALGAVEYASKVVSVTQTFDPSVAGAIDHVDLGESVSEQAHAVVGSPSSGTNVEAGLTRRYSSQDVPGSWFQFDLATQANKPVLLRMIETFDKPITKNYDIIVNGSLYKAHSYERVGTGLTTTTYQVLIDDPALLTGSKITVRLQFNGKGGDPSIADAWTLPVTAVAVPVVSAAASVPSGENGWYTGDATVALRGQDFFGAPVTLSYQLGSAAAVAYTAPVTVAAEGTTVVTGKGVDAGGRTATTDVTVKIDTTKPTVASELSASRVLTVTGTDATSGVATVEYALDGGAWKTYTAPVQLGGAAQTVTFRATDTAGLVSAVGTRAVGVGQPFADVPASHPFATEINWMFTSGLSTGTAQPTGSPKYLPTDVVTRQAMAAFLYRLNGDDWQPATGVQTFADVKPGNQFYVPIEWMAHTGLSTGFPQTSGKPLFKPGAGVARDAAMAFLWRSAGSPTGAPTSGFVDVAGDQFIEAINWGVAQGITTGFAGNKFRPSAQVDRQAMAAFLYRTEHQ